MLTDFRALSFKRNRLVVLIAQVSIKKGRPAVNPGKELGLGLHCSQKKKRAGLWGDSGAGRRERKEGQLLYPSISLNPTLFLFCVCPSCCSLVLVFFFVFFKLKWSHAVKNSPKAKG